MSGRVFRSLLCCCGSDAMGRRSAEKDTMYDYDEDLLLPGDLQWDKASKSFRKSTVGNNTDGYVPPRVPDPTYNSSDEDNKHEVPTIHDFKLLKTVGKGAFGKVMMAIHTSTHTLYAIKAVPKAKIATQKQIRQIVSEVRILKKVKNPFCVSLQFAFQDDDCLFYVFEFAAGGMLFYHLREEGRFGETKARFYIGEIILALEYLHGFGIIFRDLKPENCMLSAIGHVLLTDFGSAKQLTGAEKTATLAGTPHYMAPEVLRGEPYSYSADWWSTGVILYEMLVGRTPFNSADRLELYRTILRCSFKVPTIVSLRAQSLLFRLIERNPEIRLGYTGDSQKTSSATEIKEHGFFSATPLTEEEETKYLLEEMEHQKMASTRQRGMSTESLGSAAGSLVRKLSMSTGRFSTVRYQGTPCEWYWEKLANEEVDPPFLPKLSHPTDCSYFDPIMTRVPPTVEDLIGTSLTSSSRRIRVEGFNFSVLPSPSSPAPSSPASSPMSPPPSIATVSNVNDMPLEES